MISGSFESGNLGLFCEILMAPVILMAPPIQPKSSKKIERNAVRAHQFTKILMAPLIQTRNRWRLHAGARIRNIGLNK
jgi:hypothetical protein